MKGLFTVLLICISINSVAQDTEAESTLRARGLEFERKIYTIAPGVYTAVGYSPANSSMIVGTEGVVIIDTGMNAQHASDIVKAFKTISDLPVRGIIYTHDHGDHTGGASAFIGEEPPEIWAMANFGSEAMPFSAAGLTIQGQRGVKQAGFSLPATLRINNGIAPAMQPGRANAFVSDENASINTQPTHTFEHGRKAIEIAGIKLELVAAPGETDDQLYVWLPDQRVLFTGDNFYKSFPNLYAIRGTPYRDVYAWANSLDLMIDEDAIAVVPGHTSPVIGEQESRMALTLYRDAIRYVHDKTVEGMNAGLTMDELAASVTLPDHLANNPDLGEYYGRVAWAVRSIFTGYLGWYDGNPTTLMPLSPHAEALRLADLAGGTDRLLTVARTALEEDDAQWAAQLSDYLLALNANDNEAKLIKADALTILARNSVNALGRNYYLTVANLLRQEANLE